MPNDPLFQRCQVEDSVSRYIGGIGGMEDSVLSVA